MRYPAKISCEPDGCSVTFVDIPEALTCGATLDEALHHGVDALESAMDFYFEDKRPIPVPSKLRKGQHWIELPTTTAAKILLHNETLAQKVRPAELARRLSIAPPHVTRLLDLRHPTKIDSIASALNALGKTLELRIL